MQNNNKTLHALEFHELQRYNLNLSEALYAYGKEIEIDSETSIEIKVIDTFLNLNFIIHTSFIFL